jgi:hypothetical protein
MWDAWGGTSGVEWAINKLKEIDSKKMSSCSCFSKEENISHLFDNIGVLESDYEIIESLDINFNKDGSPMEFATAEQETSQKILKAILDNPLMLLSELAAFLELSFDELIGSISILSKSNLLEIEGSTLSLTPKGEQISKTLDIPSAQIKYRYSLRPDAPALKEGSKSRDFCQDMMRKSKLYSKAEIELLRNDMPSSGIADVTNVWLARGGWYRKPDTDTSIPYCRHIWRQVIVRKK